MSKEQIENSYEKYLEELIEELSSLRKSSGVTQKELGVLMGKPQSSIARFENGKIKDPGLSFLYLYTNKLGVSFGLKEDIDSDFTKDRKRQLIEKFKNLIDNF